MGRKKDVEKGKLAEEAQISVDWLKAISAFVRGGSALLMLLIVIVIALLLYFILSSAVFKPKVLEEPSEVEKVVETTIGTEEKFITNIKHAIKKGTDINAKQNRNGQTLLHLAVKAGYAKAAELLLDNGADVNARNVMEATPLHLAVIEDNPEIVKILIAHGADLNAKSKYLSTPLYNAADCGKVEIVKLLLENGADVNARIEHGNTPLKAAQTLLKYEHLMKKNNTTPEKQREIVKILRAYGGKE